MTDPGMADRTYIGPMTPELVEQILAKVCNTSRGTNQMSMMCFSTEEGNESPTPLLAFWGSLLCT